MAGKTPYEAVENFLAPLRRAVARVTRDQLTLSPGGHVPRAEPHVVSLSRGGTTVLRGDLPLEFALSMQYRIVEAEDERGPWKTKIEQYAYSLRLSGGGNGPELLGWHWHPLDTPHYPDPHVHVGAVALAPNGGLTRKMHIPTARVSLEEVLRFAIVDLGVRALRADWDEVLRETQRTFERWRTWP